MGDDLDRIMAVMEAAFDPRWGEAWNRKQVSDSLLMPTTFYRLLAVDGSTPQIEDPAVCFAMVRAAPGEEELLLIATDPKYRGRGLGSRMIDLLVEDAQARGADRLFLEMRENNPARAPYAKRGFETIGRRADYYRTSDGTRLDAITFAKSLQDNMPRIKHRIIGH